MSKRMCPASPLAGSGIVQASRLEHSQDIRPGQRQKKKATAVSRREPATAGLAGRARDPFGPASTDMPCTATDIASPPPHTPPTAVSPAADGMCPGIGCPQWPRRTAHNLRPQARIRGRTRGGILP